MSNVQLPEKESVRIFLDSETGRILGMAPASVKSPMVPGVRFTSELLQHAADIERWLNKWRVQVKEEATIRTERQAARDAIFRNSIASQIRQRNLSVNQYNRDENNRLLAKMDADYDRKQKAQMNPHLYGMAETSEADKTNLEVAMESPYFKHGPEIIAQGDRVDPNEEK